MPLGLVEAHLEKFNADSRPKSLSDPLCTVMASSAKHALVKTTLAPFVTYGQHGGASRSIEDPHHTIAASSKDQNCIAAATLAPFVVPVTHQGDSRVHDIEEPLRTVTGAHRGELALAGAFLTKFATGNDSTSPNDPTQTIETKSKQAVVGAFLSTFNGSNTTGGGGDAEEPLKTARAGGQHHSVVAAHMAQFNSNPDGSVNAGHDMRDLVSTIATRGPHQGVIETTLVEEGDLPPEMLDRAVLTAAFLIKYYGEGGQSQAADRPLDVVTTKARYAVVTVTIDAVTYVIVDIGLRMLKPRELARAQGFPEGYVLDPIVRKLLRGKWVDARLTIAEQISAIGNSVCPPVARALVAANQPGIVPMRLAA
jgi:DNA (cytosine-5)-methyltransferase 1